MAQEAASGESEVTFGDYTAYYSAFNSTFVQPDIANTYNLKRDPRVALINIAVHYKGKPIKARLEGTATNLLQHKKILSFQLIDEQGFYYYLAPINFTNEEIIKFTIKATTDNGKVLFDFSKKFYEG